MTWELVTTLPEGTASRTVLARRAGRWGVLRELEGHPAAPEVRGGPAVLALRELAVVAGVRYAVYDLVAAVSLEELLEAFAAKGEAMPVGVACTVVEAAARALATVAPARPHGGLSDAALLVGFDGQTRVMDFGAPRAGRFLPGGRPSSAGDVFALGAVLHCALTGYVGRYADALRGGTELAAPSGANLDVPPALDDVVSRALARDAGARQPDAQHFADELRRVMGESLLDAGALAQVTGALLAGRRAWFDELERRAAAQAPREFRESDEDPGERTASVRVPWATSVTAPDLPPAGSPLGEEGEATDEHEVTQVRAVAAPGAARPVEVPWGPPAGDPEVTRLLRTSPTPLDELEPTRLLARGGAVAEEDEVTVTLRAPASPPRSAEAVAWAKKQEGVATPPLGVPRAEAGAEGHPPPSLARALIAGLLVAIAAGVGLLAVLAPERLEPLRALLGVEGAAEPEAPESGDGPSPR